MQVIKPQIIQKPQNQSCTQIYINKTYANTEHKIFEELVPSVSPLLKKHIKLGHADIVDHSTDLSITDFKKVLKKRNGQKQSKIKILYKCITANASAMWQHAAHTADQLTSPSCYTGAIRKAIP